MMPKDAMPAENDNPANSDPELSALPKPRRPWRRATLSTLALVTLSAAWLALALRTQVAYALKSGQPTELGDLTELEPSPALDNAWVHASGVLSKEAVGYRRPIDGDRFRLAQVDGNPRIWVELREPASARLEFFVPPTSFVGKLVPIASPGLRHRDLLDALAESGQRVPGNDAWLLIDGESPSTTRWVLGLLVLVLGFAGFGVWGLSTLLRPRAAHKARTA